MSFTFFPQIAYLARTGRWRLKRHRSGLVAERAYVAVPEGMDAQAAYDLLERHSKEAGDGSE